ncbi:MAG: 3-isopropylmalate dehydratase [Candidatus Heimdallarchaeota archaeon]|nr:3-isopropylmalate dehydratase [Candidatus Heimdallarchaeota archaeon]MDH5646604.1 3-isopropylmalate dehydratase [Candidatus Heimdallarchaeota archaeon]
MEVSNIRGKAMKFGDKMNTDIIIPSQYLEHSDPNVYCKYVMAAIRPSTWEEIQERGDTVFIGGIDFGSGSSREQAPDAIKFAGVKCVVAESFATIFFRNCVNVGLPLLEVKGISEKVDEGDEVVVDLHQGVIINQTRNITIQGQKLEPFLLNKMEKGGLIPELQDYVKQHQLDQ